MSYMQAVILGVVEGLTEFLPVSSTGHLILAVKALGVSPTDFVKSFEIVIQLGAILAVVFLYFRKFLDVGVLKRLAVSFAPTAVIGLIFYKLIKDYLLGSTAVVVAALFFGGIALIIFEFVFKKKIVGDDGGLSTLSYKQAFLIGVFQSISIIPGVSRAAATILGGLALGRSRKTIVEYSFLLAVPTIIGATVLDLYKNWSTFSSDQFGIFAVGFLVSFAVAAVAIKLLLRFVKTHNFTAFGWYRIAIAAAAYLTFF